MSRKYLNRKARRKIAEYCKEHNITRCEIQLPDCMGEAHHPAHRRRKGKEYRGLPDEALWHLDEWVASCVKCHQKIDADPELLEETFNRLRGESKYNEL